jgi:hypothetical protein
MKVSDAFPSRFLKAADLAGRSPVVTIAKVTRETFDDGARLVLAFAEGSKLLALNKTNANANARLHGDETDLWLGRKIRLTVLPVDYRGSQVPAIRVAAAEAPAPPKDDPFGGLGDGPDF